jgi:1-deoxy-D-xylulose-5-phosphate synthase
MRVLPNMTVMAPGDAADAAAMLRFALNDDGPCSIRYPKMKARQLPEPRSDVELGKAEIIEWGSDGVLVCCGALLPECLAAAATLREEGLDVGVINARFVKPLDRHTILKAVRECGFVVTVEEGCLAGGFGSAVLEAAADAELAVGHVHRLGIPDRFVEHATRSELLADLGLDADGICGTSRRAAAQAGLRDAAQHGAP